MDTRICPAAQMGKQAQKGHFREATYLTSHRSGTSNGSLLIPKLPCGLKHHPPCLTFPNSLNFGRFSFSLKCEVVSESTFIAYNFRISQVSAGYPVLLFKMQTCYSNVGHKIISLGKKESHICSLNIPPLFWTTVI